MGIDSTLHEARQGGIRFIRMKLPIPSVRWQEDDLENRRRDIPSVGKGGVVCDPRAFCLELEQWRAHTSVRLQT
jgi:hypothetical protein